MEYVSEISNVGGAICCEHVTFHQLSTLINENLKSE